MLHSAAAVHAILALTALGTALCRDLGPADVLPDFKHAAGAFLSGDDLEEHIMSTGEAAAHCLALPKCQGFDFKAKSAWGPARVYFKTLATERRRQAGWHSFERRRKPSCTTQAGKRSCRKGTEREARTSSARRQEDEMESEVRQASATMRKHRAQMKRKVRRALDDFEEEAEWQMGPRKRKVRQGLGDFEEEAEWQTGPRGLATATGRRERPWQEYTRETVTGFAREVRYERREIIRGSFATVEEVYSSSFTQFPSRRYRERLGAGLDWTRPDTDSFWND